MTSVAVIFIGTNKYLNFLPQWYDRVKKHLFPDVAKTIYVYTDGDLGGDIPPDMIVVPTEHKDWPRITLERFHTIRDASLKISTMRSHTHLLFLDADMFVNEDVAFEDVFPEDKDYTGVWHPCHFMKMPPHNSAPGAFEPNPKSTAYLENAYDYDVYWQGCLWGGKIQPIMHMLDVLCARIDEDDSNDIIALWHDETHMIKFFCEHADKVNTLPPCFAFPECYPDYPTNQTIIHLAKDNSKYHV